jgi:hypothetical protein
MKHQKAMEEENKMSHWKSAILLRILKETKKKRASHKHGSENVDF